MLDLLLVLSLPWVLAALMTRTRKYTCVDALFFVHPPEPPNYSSIYSAWRLTPDGWKLTPDARKALQTRNKPDADSL